MLGRYKLDKLDWFNTGFLALFHVLAIVSLVMFVKTESFTWSLLGLFLFFYFASGFGITMGYHRLFSHKAYKAHPVVKFFLLIFGAAAFENSCLKWSADHRIHHTHVDTEKDPYNINEGFFFAHMGWILLKERELPKMPKDLTSDRLVMWQHNYYLPISISFSILLPILIGYFFMDSFWGAMFFGAFGRIVFVHHATFFINSLCHIVGYQTFSDSHTAKDSPIMALFTYGEGYHNFHHEFQTDYRNGIRFYDYDPTKWLIKLFNILGLAYDLKQTPDEDILKAKIRMQKVRLDRKIGTDSPKSEMLNSLYNSFEESLSNLKKLRNDYSKCANSLKESSKEAVVELKINIEKAQRDFELALQNLRQEFQALA